MIKVSNMFINDVDTYINITQAMSIYVFTGIDKKFHQYSYGIKYRLGILTHALTKFTLLSILNFNLM